MILALLLIFGSLKSSVSLASSFTKAWIAVSPDQHINDLKWDNEYTRIRTEKSGLGDQSSVLLVGNYYRDQWKLTSNQKEISRNDRGGFKLEVPITADETSYIFEAIGPNGEREKERIDIRTEEGSELKTSVFNSNLDSESQIQKPVKRFFLVPGVGVSSISTKQTDVSDYSTIAITAKVSANYRLVPQKWDAGLSAYGTVAQLSKSSDVTARYLGFNARLGYLIPNISSDWFLSVYGGWYFTTTTVSEDTFGYQNLSGPQIYPSVRKVLGNGDVISAYFKFSPVASSFSVLTMSNREIAGGVAYIRLLPDDHSLAATFDISNIKLTIDGIVTQTNTLTLGIQYGL